jgi:hypothetical protein
METTGDPKPWEQQPGESDRDFEAFQIWVALQPGGTKQAVADRLCCSRPLIHKIAKRWDWPARLAAFHKHQPSGPAPAELLAPQDTAAVLIENVLSDQQVSHLQKISDYQARAERLGNAQISIAGQLLQIVQQRLTQHRDGKIHRLPTDMERLIRAATIAMTSGHKLVGDALGIEELFLTMQQHLQADDPALKPPEPLDVSTT